MNSSQDSYRSNDLHVHIDSKIFLKLFLSFLFLGPVATMGLKLCAGDSPSINVTLTWFFLELGILVMFPFWNTLQFIIWQCIRYERICYYLFLERHLSFNARKQNPVLLFCSFTFVCTDLATRNSIVLTTTTCSKVTCLLVWLFILLCLEGLFISCFIYSVVLTCQHTAFFALSDITCSWHSKVWHLYGYVRMEGTKWLSTDRL